MDRLGYTGSHIWPFHVQIDEIPLSSFLFVIGHCLDERRWGAGLFAVLGAVQAVVSSASLCAVWPLRGLCP